MLNPDRTRLEVWGDPIAHSRSPLIHAAAYGLLRLDWTYGRRRVREDEVPVELAGLDHTWRGLSLTYPLKGAAFAASAELDRGAELSGAVNTLLLDDDGARGFNTDIGGLVRSLREAGFDALDEVRIVGAGATSTAALIAVAELGAARVDVVARRPVAVAPLQELGAHLGVEVLPVPFTAPEHAPVPLTLGTLPGEAVVPLDAADALADAGGLLMDVVYGHWPTTLAAAWQRAGSPAQDGLAMLLHQALLQVRIFLFGSPHAPLPDEDAVLDAMRVAVTQS